MKTNNGKFQGVRLLAWIVLPLLLVAAIAAGSFAMFGAHAAAPTGTHYNFRGITLTGPDTGLYLTGSMVLFVDARGDVTGNICSLRVATQRCTLLSGTQNSSAIVITIKHLKGYAALVLTGTQKNGAKQPASLEGTYTLGTSHGKWVATTAAFPALSGSWTVSGNVHQGKDINKQFHGIMTLLQQANGDVAGTYCPIGGACVNVTGGKNRGNFFFYINVAVLKQVIHFQGSFVAKGKTFITGQFESLNPNLPTADRGYWVGH